MDDNEFVHSFGTMGTKGTLFVVKPVEVPYCNFYAFKDGHLVFEVRGTVGRNGVSTGRKQGDGTTPAGVFGFKMCFGKKDAPEGMSLPYKKLDEHDWWDGDMDSDTYNMYVDDRKMSDSWRREESEHLITFGSYNYCAAIGFNMDPVVKGLGSAIFLHCTNPTFTGTAGCVGLPEPYMIKALQMMEEDTKIAILPADIF